MYYSGACESTHTCTRSFMYIHGRLKMDFLLDLQFYARLGLNLLRVLLPCAGCGAFCMDIRVIVEDDE